jgi:hypothetical protein
MLGLSATECPPEKKIHKNLLGIVECSDANVQVSEVQTLAGVELTSLVVMRFSLTLF